MYCTNCNNTFSLEDASTYYVGNSWDPEHGYHSKCPFCGSEDFEEEIPCEDCGDPINGGSHFSGLCDGCADWILSYVLHYIKDEDTWNKFCDLYYSDKEKCIAEFQVLYNDINKHNPSCDYFHLIYDKFGDYDYEDLVSIDCEIEGGE